MRQKSKSISGLEAHLGYWIRFVSNRVSHAFSLKVADCGVTVAEWVILRVLYDRDSLVPSSLAEKIGMTRGAVSKLADRLEGKTLVARIANEQDRRYQALALTQKGRALVPKLCALADQNDEKFFGHLRSAERKLIERVMREIIRRHGLRSVPVE